MPRVQDWARDTERLNTSGPLPLPFSPIRWLYGGTPKMLYERGWKGCRAHHGPDGLEKGAARVRTSGLLKAKFIKHQSQQRGALQSEWCLVAPQGPGTPIPGSHGVRPADPRFYPKCIEGGWAWMRRAVGSSSSPGSFWEPIVLGGHSSR